MVLVFLLLRSRRYSLLFVSWVYIRIGIIKIIIFLINFIIIFFLLLLPLIINISFTSVSSRIVAAATPLSCTWLSSEGVLVSSSSSAPSSLANERSSDDDYFPIFEAKQVYYHCFVQWMLLHAPSPYPCCYMSCAVLCFDLCVSSKATIFTNTLSQGLITTQHLLPWCHRFLLSFRSVLNRLLCQMIWMFLLKVIRILYKYLDILTSRFMFHRIIWI